MDIFKPMRGKILVKIFKDEKVTKSGILIADSVESGSPEKAEVIAIGAPAIDHGKEIPLEVKVGDKVYVNKSAYGKVQFNIDGVDHYILSEDDLVGII